ncbi:MAG: acyl-CoA thioesterase [Thermoanaerobaculia bacterium]|nr:acyl-CoA thioesterase [Thermoanaerobaculia bacterium]
MSLRRAFEYHHIVGFEETNLVGNVYYANHIRWQGRCREMFLHQHCPEILAELQRDLALITLRCSCEYLSELAAFDALTVRMRLAELTQNRIVFSFDYVKRGDGFETLAARGEQAVACMRRTAEGGLEPCPVPRGLREALKNFQ